MSLDLFASARVPMFSSIGALFSPSASAGVLPALGVAPRVLSWMVMR
jgi:hypothetical protein